MPSVTRDPDAGVWSCFGGLFGVSRRQQSDVVPNESFDKMLDNAVRAAVAKETEHVHDKFSQDLRGFEVAVAGTFRPVAQWKPRRRLDDLQMQLVQMEHQRRWRTVEVDTLRKVLKEVRSIIIDESTPLHARGAIAAEQLLSEIRNERENWRDEKRHLEEQIRILEDENSGHSKTLVIDSEKEKLKQSVKQLQMSIDSRDRYACWVCNQRAAREGEEKSENSDAFNEDDEITMLQRQVACFQGQLRKLRTGESPRGESPRDETPTSFNVDAANGLARSPKLAGDKRSVQFSDNVKTEVVPMVGTRTSRSRIPTPFVLSETVGDAQPRVQISDETPNVERTAVNSRVIRDRVPTPHVSFNNLESSNNDTEERSVQFSEAVSTEPVPAVGVGRSSRNRIATPHFGDPSTLEPTERKQTQVRWASEPAKVNEVEVPLDNPPMRAARDRIPTPHFTLEGTDLAADAPAVEKRVSVLDPVSTQTEEDESGGSRRRARGRIATPFVSSGSHEFTEDRQPRVQISVDPPNVEEVGVQPNVRMRASRERIPTPFAALQPVDYGIHFAERNNTESADSPARVEEVKK